MSSIFVLRAAFFLTHCVHCFRLIVAGLVHCTALNCQCGMSHWSFTSVHWITKGGVSHWHFTGVHWIASVVPLTFHWCALDCQCCPTDISLVYTGLPVLGVPLAFHWCTLDCQCGASLWHFTGVHWIASMGCMASPRLAHYHQHIPATDYLSKQSYHYAIIFNSRMDGDNLRCSQTYCEQYVRGRGSICECE